MQLQPTSTGCAAHQNSKWVEDILKDCIREGRNTSVVSCKEKRELHTTCVQLVTFIVVFFWLERSKLSFPISSSEHWSVQTQLAQVIDRERVQNPKQSGLARHTQTHSLLRSSVLTFNKTTGHRVGWWSTWLQDYTVTVCTLYYPCRKTSARTLVTQLLYGELHHTIH